MKIRIIARNTFGSFLHNKFLIAWCLPIAFFLLLGLYAISKYKSLTTASNSLLMQRNLAHDLSGFVYMLGGLGNLLAVWAAAYSIASEIQSGTALAVMARPLRRWQFLAGKYLGVLMLMSTYAVGMFGVIFLLMSLGGLPSYASWWVLVLYPFVRYAIWAAIAMFLVNFASPVVVIGLVAFLLSVTQFLVTPSAINDIPSWIRLPLHLTLPLTTVVLNESRFFSMTQAALQRYPWTYHLTALTYGMDYALVFFLLAIALFQRRSLA